MVVKCSANTKIPSQVNVKVTYGVAITLPIASYISSIRLGCTKCFYTVGILISNAVKTSKYDTNNISVQIWIS